MVIKEIIVNKIKEKWSNNIKMSIEIYKRGVYYDMEDCFFIECIEWK